MNRIVVALSLLLIYVAGMGVGAGFGYSLSSDSKKEEIEKARVESFNDGFMDGLCRNGEDGRGVPCG